MVSKGSAWLASIGFAAIAVFIALAQPATAQDETSGWKLHKQSESCYISRDFETVSGPLNLIIMSFGPTTPYHFVLRGNAVPFRKERAEEASVGFKGEDSAIDMLVLLGGSKSRPTAVMLAYAPGPLFLSIRFYSQISKPYHAAQSIDRNSPQDLFVRFADGASISLPLGDMSKEYSRLDDCAAAVDAQWRSKAQDPHPAVVPKLLDQKTFIPRVTYPQALLVNRFSSVVEVRMMVGTDGRAHDCVVRNSTWQRLFGEDTCKNFEQWARFEPAKDADGNAVEAPVSTAFSYMITDL